MAQSNATKPGGFSRRFLQPGKKQVFKNKIIYLSGNTNRQNIFKELKTLFNNHKIEQSLQKKIGMNLKQKFSKFLKEKENVESYSEWLLTQYPLSDKIKTRDVYQIKIIPSPTGNIKYKILGSGNKKKFLIEGSKTLNENDTNIMNQPFPLNRPWMYNYIYDYNLKITIH